MRRRFLVNADHNDIFDISTAQQKKRIESVIPFFSPDSTIFQKRDLTLHIWYDIIERNRIYHHREGGLSFHAQYFALVQNDTFCLYLRIHNFESDGWSYIGESLRTQPVKCTQTRCFRISRQNASFIFSLNSLKTLWESTFFQGTKIALFSRRRHFDRGHADIECILSTFLAGIFSPHHDFDTEICTKQSYKWNNRDTHCLAFYGKKYPGLDARCI